jgi:hypothetical protein
MNKSRLKFILKVTLVAAPTTAMAEPIQEWRCTTDSLGTTAALQRIEWARKCGLTTNSSGPDSWFLSTKAFAQNFEWAKDYRENNTARAFTGNLNAYNVNYYYGYARYESTPQYTVNQETLGATVDYWKWSHTVQRPRPLYPSFENTPVAGSGTQLFPHPTLADCNLYTDKTGSATTRWTSDYYVIAYCESSCYTPDQSLRFSDGDVNIVDAMKAQRDDVITLSPDATLDNLAKQTSNVYSYTAEIRDAEHVIYRVTTTSGGSLSVTNEHPVVTSEGRLVKAEKLNEGDELVKADGTPDPIVKIEKTTHFGKVYNIKPVSRERVSNILIAQGYLVGSARFQNDDVGYMNRVLLFRGVPDEVMPR